MTTGLAVLAIVSGCSENGGWRWGAKPKPFQCTAETVLPQAVHAHPWAPSGDPVRYTPANLEENIDGAARPYLEYGMTQLIHATYAHKAAPQRQIDVDVYEMVSPTAAYGIYSIQRPAEAETVRLGGEGFWSDGLLCFVKSRLFVAIQTPGEGPRDMASAMLIGCYIDDHVSLSADLPTMIAAMPERDHVKHSVKFQAANMLGHRFLGAGWQATYRYRGVTHDLFVVPCDTPAQAVERYEALAEAIGKDGKVVRKVDGIGRAALIGTGKSIGRLFVACSGKVLVGTIDCYDDDLAVRRSRQTIENVTRMRL